MALFCLEWNDQLISEASYYLRPFCSSCALCALLSMRLLTYSVHGLMMSDYDCWWCYFRHVAYTFRLLPRAFGSPSRPPVGPPPPSIIVINDMTMDQRCGVNICGWPFADMTVTEWYHVMSTTYEQNGGVEPRSHSRNSQYRSHTCTYISLFIYKIPICIIIYLDVCIRSIGMPE